MLLNKLFQRRNEGALAAQSAYEKIVAQARHPVFYLSGGVEDSVDGRFDMIVLHMWMLIHRLNEDEGESASDFGQAVFDVMFEDMDRSLREMGVGDLSVGKKVKKMAQVFYGRAKAYDAGLSAYEEDPANLIAALGRNLLPEAAEMDRAERMAHYVVAAQEALNDQPTSTIVDGDVRFADPERFL